MLKKLAAVAVLLISAIGLSADNRSGDVFAPIAKYIAQGDAESLSAWFADNLEVTVGETTTDASAGQARQIMKKFFADNAPTSFEIEHTASGTNMKYALGVLKCGGETYNVTIFVSFKAEKYRIQQLKFTKER